jgi:hypothetical protein
MVIVTDTPESGRISNSARRRRRRTAGRSARRSENASGAPTASRVLDDAAASVAETLAATDAVEDDATPEDTIAAGTSAEQAPGPAPKTRTRRTDNPSREGMERGLRDLVGAGRSQLGVSGALRGRDVNRPTDEDIAEAEEKVVLVRRNWKPPA